MSMSKRKLSENITSQQASEQRAHASSPIIDDDRDDSDRSSDIVPNGHKTKRIRASIVNKSEATHDKESFSYGSIEKVELVNFMCHDFLQISLGKKINFIVGHNGSGKSAILTALMVCLGGKASITSRGTNIQALLKEGTNVGSVTVTLRNEGNEPYRGDDYGDRIIIERRIVRNGSSTYKIKSSTGKVISNRREELVSICDYFNIDVSNPMSILTQDTARMFLASGTSRDKYLCFLKGTQLESLRTDYETIDELLATSKRITDKKSQHLPELQKEVIALEQKLDSIKAARHLELRVNELQGELIWKRVQHLEDNLEDLNKDAARLNAKFNKAEKEVEDAQAERLEQQGRLEELKLRAAQITAQAEPVNQRHRELLQEAREHQNRERNLRIELEDRETDKRNHQKSLRSIEDRIREQEQRLSVDTNAIRRQKLQTIAQLEQRKAEVDQRLMQIAEEEQQTIAETEQSQSMLDQMRQHKSSLEQQVRAIDSKIFQARQQSGDKLKRYHENMPAMVRMIEDYARQGRWRSGKPIGPIGLHIKLRNPAHSMYLKAIETHLQYSINSFMTHDEHDIRLLKDIKQRTRCDAPLIKNRRRNIDFSSGEPDGQYLTILRALNFDNRAVMDELIISQEIEKVVLVEDRQEGDRVTAHGYPRNVKRVITKDCQNMGSKSGERSLMWMNEYNGPPRLEADMSHYIQRLEDDRRSRVQELQSIEQEYARVTAMSQQWTQRMRDLTKQRVHLQRQATQMENEMRNIQDSIEEEEPDTLLYLQQEKAQSLDLLQAIDIQIEKMTNAVMEIQGVTKELAYSVDNIARELAVLQEELNRVKVEIQHAGNTLMQLDRNIMHYRGKQDEYQEAYRQKLEEVEKFESQLKEHIQVCEERHARVETKRSEDEIKKDLRESEARLRQSHEEFGSFEEVNTALIEKRVEYERVLEETNNMQELIRVVMTSLNSRLRAYVDLRQMISIRSKRLFAELLQKRGYRGVLELDHEKEILHLHVDVRDEDVEEEEAVRAPASASERKKSNAGGRGKDEGAEVLALSGGEKSFATVCLLLSLWASMSSPFRALDEFDVFMDATNRQLAMQLMIDEARAENNSSQYLLITPQNMSKVKGMNGPDIRICKLSDPERNQTRLNFAPA